MAQDLFPVDQNLLHRIVATTQGSVYTPSHEPKDVSRDRVIQAILSNLRESLKAFITRTRPSYGFLPLIQLTDYGQLDAGRALVLGTIQGDYRFGTLTDTSDYTRLVHPGDFEEYNPFAQQQRDLVIDKDISPGFSSHWSISPLEFAVTARSYVAQAVKEVEAAIKFGTKNYAIIIANPDGDEKLLPFHMSAYTTLQSILEDRLFTIISNASESIYPDGTRKVECFAGVSKSGLEKYLRQATVLPKDARLLFVYMGHGSSNGEMCLHNGERMSYRELYLHLDRISAKKYVILEACHSGGAVDDSQIREQMPERTLVLAAARQDQLAYAGQLVNAFASLLKEDIPINLEELHTELERRVKDSTPRKGVEHRADGNHTMFVM